jgi:hypothetical protein
MMPDRFSTPEWVLLGFRMDGWFWALGSMELDRAELQREVNRHDVVFGDDRRRVERPLVTTVTCEIGKYVIAKGRTYAEALDAVMGYWSPDGRTRPMAALPSSRPQITEGGGSDSSHDRV